MSSPGALVVITCNETDSRIDPSRYFNLNAPSTKVFKTAGGRTSPAINNIYYADQATRIGMIVVVQHTNCSTSTPATTESNVREDINALKDSPHVRNDLPIVGYVLNTETGQLREVKYVLSPSPSRAIVQSPVMPLVWHAVEGSPPRLSPSRKLPSE